MVNAARAMEAMEPEPEHRGELEAELFRRLAPAVVLVVTTDDNGKWTGLGSGSIIDADGAILTNLHVVGDHEWVLIFLRPEPGHEFGKAYVGVVQKTDAIADLALVKMTAPPDGLPVVPLGTLSTVEVGEDVHAIGHPVGETWTYTKGLVSQVRPNYEWTIGSDTHHATVIQTQTPINPGNSGGPLFDNAGRLVGVNTFLNSEAQGINYAVAVDEIDSFLARRTSRGAARAADSANWSPKAGIETSDRDGDGDDDLWVSDTDGDGMPECIIYDDDSDGVLDGALYDSNENGKPEAQSFDTDGDGKIDCYKFDVDEDGTWDEFAIDSNQDGTADYVERL